MGPAAKIPVYVTGQDSNCEEGSQPPRVGLITTRTKNQILNPLEQRKKFKGNTFCGPDSAYTV